MATIPYGYCHCGCGDKAPVSTRTQNRNGWVKGEPKRFIFNHDKRIPGTSYTLEDRESDGASIPYGYCHCGCGRKTNIVTYNRRRGIYKGQPMLFLRGHNREKPEYVVNEETGCWEWQRHKYWYGHGKCSPNETGTSLAHRRNYIRKYGPVAAGVQLHHKCNNPGCVNPDHLQPVTAREHAHLRPDLKLTEEAVREIRSLYATGKHTYSDLADRFGISSGHVGQVVRRGRWA